MPGEPQLYGLPAGEARKRVGDLRQLARIDEVSETQGPARGARRITLHSGGGLSVDLLPDRALDIGAVSYRGVPIAWHSPTGFVAPALAVNAGTEWLRSFGGGLLATCGLDAYGPASRDDGVDYPMHGRVGTVPAHVTRAQVTDEALVVEGEVRQATVFGENLLLRRRITVPLGSGTILVDDTVTNESSADAGHMVLYHANIGWPLLDEGATLRIPSHAVSPRDAAAEQGMADWFDLQPPTPGYAEQVFKHDFSGGGLAEVSVDNPAQDTRLALRFDTEGLPALHQWKMLGDGHYVLGLEPTNVDWSRGRAAAAAENALPRLAPGTSASYHLEFHLSGSRSTTPGTEGSSQ